MTSSLRITFGIIVLNGEPFTRYNLRSLYPFAHQIIVVEGASPHAACIAGPDGHSTDGTLEVLRRFKAEEDPENKLQIVTAEDCGHPNGFWPGEKNEQSQAYATRATGDWLWQVDIDEFYRPEDMRKILNLLGNEPDTTAVSFENRFFWGSPDVLVDGFHLRAGAGEFHRLFRFGPGYSYEMHRPPTVIDPRGADLRTLRWIRGKQLARQGIFLYHYSMLFPKQVKEKCDYYAEAFLTRNSALPNWASSVYERLEHPFGVQHSSQRLSWLTRFRGSHPPEVTRMLDDIRSGTINVAMRQTEDIETLLKSPWYALIRMLLLACSQGPIQQVWTAVSRAPVVAGQIAQWSMRRFWHLLGGQQLVGDNTGLFRSLLSPRILGRVIQIRAILRLRRGINLKRVRNLLVIRPDQVGDLVLTSAFLRELRHNLPTTKIALIVKPDTANLVELCPYVNEVLTYNASPRGPQRHAETIASLFPLLPKLRRRRFDLAIVPRWGTDHYYSSQLACLSGARFTVAYSEHACVEKESLNRGYDRFFTHVLSRKSIRHEVESNLEVLSCLGCKIEDSRLELWLSDDDKEWARSRLGGLHELAQRPLIGMVVGASDPKKVWPLERYVTLGNWLVRENRVRVVAFGGPGEAALGVALAEHLGENVINLVGPCTLRQMGAALLYCPLVVGNDSGPMHMAAAQGSRTIVISCHPANADEGAAYSPRRFRPWGDGHVVIQPPQPATGCTTECASSKPHCILGVSLSEVQATLRDLIPGTIEGKSAAS